MKKKISLILTVYNEEKLVSDCLSSLFVQTYRSLEIIVVDDGSTDKTRSILSEFQISLTGQANFPYRVNKFQIIYQKHLGLGPSRNRGAKEAKGEILVFCDADLIYDENYIANLVKPIIEGNVIGTFHLTEMVMNSGNFWSRCWQINDHLPKDRKIPKNFTTHGTFFRAIKRDEFLGVNGFDNVGYLDDRTLFKKLGKESLGVKGAVCWHVNPQTGREVFNEAKWHGKSLAKSDLVRSFFQHLPINTARRILIDTWSSKEYKYFLFKLIYDCGILLGIGEYLSKGKLSK